MQGKREEGSGESGNIRGEKINPYPCLDASVRHVTLNSSSVKSKMSHLSSVHPQLQTFNRMGRTCDGSEAARGRGGREVYGEQQGQKISGKQRPWCLSFSQCVAEDALSGDMEMFGKLCDAAFYQYEDIVLKCI
ncbi:hypothetical protein F7725_003066 [Dissostichus mawsoni]|uniref:Uncharacterized protein n=1 Tax=Dissostichus mawsoni TaxID=36200 RepID=A0A7J5YCB8_DISMA|nr:hypothetical protein F7725_003066 [Dissostichus mawsoni]